MDKYIHINNEVDAYKAYNIGPANLRNVQLGKASLKWVAAANAYESKFNRIYADYINALH
jgi:hypothetical protein